jgi:hypothetical protein
VTALLLTFGGIGHPLLMDLDVIQPALLTDQLRALGRWLLDRN